MPQAKQTSKRKCRSKALPVLGAAGLSLSLASSASREPCPVIPKNVASTRRTAKDCLELASDAPPSSLARAHFG
jgi:hypothetical protein